MAEILNSAFYSDEVVFLRSSKAEEAVSSCTPSQNISQDTYEEAFKDGFAEGERQGKSIYEEKISQLNDLLKSIPEETASSRLHLKQEVADVVLLICQQFFIYQMQNKELWGQQISHILSQINQTQQLEVRLHPQDLMLLQHGKMTIESQRDKKLRFSADETINLGGCIIKSSQGIFDGSIESQIERLKQVLLQIKFGDDYASG